MSILMKKIDWYLKWAGTAILIAGTAVNSVGFYPAGPLILSLGGAVWLAVSIMWREPSLIVTNAVMLSTGLIGLCISLCRW
jgi:hypothetical protein